jgi:hypothetical protein
MAVAVNTVETYDNGVIFEDLQNAYTMISPEETPFQQVVARGSVSSTYHEWPVVDLGGADPTNRVPEGEEDVPNDDPIMADRLGNYTQISDKVVGVSHTNEVIDAAADNIQRLSKQVALKLRQLKLDMEVMLLDNVPALAGSTGVARQTAGLPAFIRTNTEFGVGGADPTLSGTTEGYPDTAATAGAAAPIDETTFNDLLQASWNAGAAPTMALVNGNNKRVITDTFEGHATEITRVQESRKIINALDYYESDFGVVAIVPHRFMRTNNPGGTNDSFNVILLDPDYIELLFLEEVQEKPLAETGHAKRRLVWCEYMLKVLNEKAHAIWRDTSGTPA